MNKPNKKPPVFAERILKSLPAFNKEFDIVDDFRETHGRILSKEGKIKADLWYWHQIIFTLLELISHYLSGSLMILRNYLKIANRNILKQKLNSTINILGLALGHACCILIYLYVAEEYSYDNFHYNGKYIYRILINKHTLEGNIESQSWGLAPVIKDGLDGQCPEIEHIIRYQSGRGTVRYKDKIFSERIGLADSQFFEVFTFPLKYGNPETVINRDNVVVLSESFAKKYFGEENPIGKILTVSYGKIDPINKDYVVNGISYDTPGNSTIKFNLMMNISNMPLSWDSDVLINMGNQSTPFYVQLKEKSSVASVEQKISSIYTQLNEPGIQRMKKLGFWTGYGSPFSLSLQKMADIHFDFQFGTGTDPKYSFILSGIAVIILVIASINFMNLSIGMSYVRSKEIGVRRVAGAKRNQLVKQFLTESFFLTFIAMVFGLVISGILLPKFNEFTGKQLNITGLLNLKSIFVLTLILSITGFLSGSYPAFVITRFKPVEILKSGVIAGGNRYLSKSFVIAQFVLSVLLILSAIIMESQMQFMLNYDIGYKKDGLISIRVVGWNEKKYDECLRIADLFREKTSQNSNVLGVSACNLSMGLGSNTTAIVKDNKKYIITQTRVDYDFFSTLGVEIVQGRDFSKRFSEDAIKSAIVNRALVKELGIDSPIGKTIGNPSKGYPSHLRIIGIINDINVFSLRRNIMSSVFSMYPKNGYHILMVRISKHNITETIKFLEKVWGEIQPGKLFDFSFTSEDIENQYKDEKKWIGIIQHSSIFAIFIAYLGIFGLTVLTVKRKVKEIGIRKVLGATVRQIITLILKEFMSLVAAANLIAWPVAYYIMNNWLDNFAYRIHPGFLIFTSVGLLTLLIAVVTICIQSIKAANANPVDVLKYE